MLEDKGYQSHRGVVPVSSLSCTSSTFSLHFRDAAPLVYVELGKVSELQGSARDISKSMVDPDCVAKTTMSGISSVFV